MQTPQQESESLQRLASQLASLGAESPTERRVKRVVPWVISLAIHIGFIFLALLITWTVTKPPTEDESILIVADFNALNYDTVVRMNAAENPASERPLQDRATTPPMKDRVRDALSAADSDAIKLLDAAGAGARGSGDLAQFAPRTAQSGATFVGLSSSNARKIVYVIDASGSMIAYLQIVLDELARSLENLSAQQSFGVVFFQDGSAIETPPAGKLMPATPQERLRALQWMRANVVPAGGTNPLVAIERALALKPDVIFLLSQDITGYGQFEVDQEDLMKLLDKLNPKNPSSGRRTTQINCIQFLDEDRLNTMQMIAKEHGGPNGFKFLSRRELGLGQ